MFYKKELEFFIDFIENCKIRTHIIIDNNIPENLDLGIRQLLGIDEDYFNTFDFSSLNNGKVIFLTDIFGCKYFFIHLPENDSKKALVIGPYISQIVSLGEIEEKASAYSLSPSTIKNIHKYFTAVPYISDDGFLGVAINCLCKKIYGSADNFEIIRKQNDELNDITVLIKGQKNEDEESPLVTIQMIEKAYEQENKLLNAISQGLVHKAEMFFTSAKPSNMLESRITDKLRNAKNFLIVLNTLARKAVENGGVHPIYIDSVSSDFALKIEAAKNTDECDELFFTMIRKYSRLVQKHSQKDYSLLVQKVITCIDTDITADLSLKTQAKLLNVNPSYLSTLFKKETGVTLTDYVNKKRVERAKHLLKNGNTQIQTVAQSCGILDVNYFTKIFKKYEGVTPKEYRTK